MRSKEVEKTIDYLTKYINWETYGERSLESDIETVLNYISELEQIPVLLGGYVEKNKIRDKIKELDDYYKKEVYPIRYQWADIDITEFYDSQIELLNELLEN